MLRIILVAVLVISVNSYSSEAQAQSRRTRFFQKVKEDLFGGGAKAEQQKKAAQEAAAKQQQLRLQQARAGQTGVGRVPTPVSSNNRNANSRSRVPQLPSYKSQSNSGTAANFSAPSRPPKTSLSSTTKSKYRPTTLSKRNGFGFQVKLSGNDKLTISNIDRSGNAEEAGLKRGDHVIEIGGIEATSVEEFEEIAKIMGQGDEMEFKIQRNGREKEVNVRFGNLPKIEDVEEVSRSTGEKRYDFAPPSSSEFRKPNSVLNQNNSKDFKSENGPNNNPADRQIQQLNKRIAEQNQQIQQMQQQIQRLRGGYRGR